MLRLEDSLDALKGIGQKRLAYFEKLKIFTIEDLLFYAPRDYLDYSQITSIDNLKPGKVTIKASLSQTPKSWRKGRRQMVSAIFEDDSGSVKAIWFNQPYRTKQLELGRVYMISGEYDFKAGSYGLTQPSVERVESERLSTGVVVARYPQTKGLTSRMILSAQKEALEKLSPNIDIYPPQFIKDNHLQKLAKSLHDLHFPKSEKEATSARCRLSFDEVFSLQLAAANSRQKLADEVAPTISFNEPLAKKFVSDLPFRLTDAQRLAAWEILKDISRAQPMNRMLEGKVGSGKTVVAALATLMTASSGHMGIMLAPTTILAEQHFKTLKKLVSGYGLKIALLTRHTPQKEQTKVADAIKKGKVDCLVGTHSLLSEQLEYKNIGLVIIDEQHRFGVKQRTRLRDKSSKELPHVLTMTATPIPRSLALTLYGELDISIIKQLPGGRQPINTEILAWTARSHAYTSLVNSLRTGGQAYIIAPRIEDTDSDMASVRALEKELTRSYLKDVNYAVLHGRLKPELKEKIMQDFFIGKIKVVISTSVIEVGVDNPNAVVMIVESAERFGLAQLHQLRGRVGRGNKAASCFLIASKDNEPSRRLHAMAQTNDGFKLSELDLKIRGAGALYGTRQHGPLDINIADITDKQLLAQVASAVDNFIEKGYDASNYPILYKRLLRASKVTFLN